MSDVYKEFAKFEVVEVLLAAAKRHCIMGVPGGRSSIGHALNRKDRD